MSPAARKPTSAPTPEAAEPRYAELMGELERILEDLENDAIDVDELGARVRRASELIRLCRQRLLHSREEIEQVVAELDALEAEESGEDVDDDLDDETV